MLVGCAPMESEPSTLTASDPTVNTTALPNQSTQCESKKIKTYCTDDCAVVEGLPNQITPCESISIKVIGQGVSPTNTISPSQAFALAKRAAIADGYRSIAERVAGVHVEGHDYIKNMMVQRSEVRTSVNAMIRHANVIETSYKEGLCEVEMEIILSYASVVL
ncbi:MAG: LPP20 family lipoprotein [Campylobacterales bacterium]|nr:LPP20 family lipoprotein [Campylobacterales bacterium]